MSADQSDAEVDRKKRMLDLIKNSPGASISTSDLLRKSGYPDKTFYRLLRQLRANEISHFSLDGKRMNYIRGDTPLVKRPHLRQGDLANLRAAAQLGLSLHYLCWNKYRGHKSRCLSLGESLRIPGIQRIVEGADSGAFSFHQVMDEVHSRIEQKHGDVMSSAYDLTRFCALASALGTNENAEPLLENARESIKQRIVAELAGIGADIEVYEYTRRMLESWTRDWSNENYRLLFALLNKYAVRFQIQPTTDEVIELLSNAPNVLSSDFERRALSNLANDVGIVHLTRAADHTKVRATTVENVTLHLKHDSLIHLEVDLETDNHMPKLAVAPLIYVATWLPPREGWRLIHPWILTGPRKYHASVELKAPSGPGEWYILFTFSGQVAPEFVASSTDSPSFAEPIWDDGNELANLDAKVIEGAQANGHTYANEELTLYGYVPFDLPLDAIKVSVA